ncbi:16S rRNA (guanine(966)-N(2))-methyltransferase RsmD [Candidatus Liberibacter solanacearum]|uniref:16S rRNA (Guanine(966)-N(2))-methyltransferase RsmD n=1 Tax=Candidatus Liberibacter solanacearum TaxID=556287 RepID=A0A3R7QMT9_9HYPH|nr:16S rRNA (guanine(966)-N(2))-methyltransferase RsmD [Candidatus Liberibacter solanacearum]RPD37465.1 16S rRNA (guanine(966)-N(2))-methyltransferase RsmD [Candidatus Liberibacter solanacearum]
MRIVGGKFRGRLLYTPKNRSIRPSDSRTKKALFDILTHVYPDYLASTRMLDMFAGTGSVGFEALSRGCHYVLFVDNNAESIRLIRKNSEFLGVEKSCNIFFKDVLHLRKIGNIKPFKFLYLDPPYGQGFVQEVLDIVDEEGWLEPNALVVVEEYAGSDVSVGFAFKFLQYRKYGDTKIHFFYYNPV